MNREAEKHLDLAVDYISKGDEFYRKAKPEIDAAIATGASLRDVSRYLDSRGVKKSKTWVADVIAWDGEGTLYGEDTGRRQSDAAKKILREAPMEQVEKMISTLPKERQQKIAAAADPSGYAAARVAENERVKNQTPAERKEIEAAQEAIGQPVRKAVASFAALGVVGHLEQATEDLSGMISEQTLTAESVYRIEQAHDRFVTELEVARGMAGLETA